MMVVAVLSLGCFGEVARAQVPATIVARATVVNAEPGRSALTGVRALLRVWNPRRDSERRLEQLLATISVQRIPGPGRPARRTTVPGVSRAPDAVISIQFLRN
jgi:hypothetical protein